MMRDDPISRQLPPYRAALAQLRTLASSPELLAPLRTRSRGRPRAADTDGVGDANPLHTDGGGQAGQPYTDVEGDAVPGDKPRPGPRARDGPGAGTDAADRVAAAGGPAGDDTGGGDATERARLCTLVQLQGFLLGQGLSLRASAAWPKGSWAGDSAPAAAASAPAGGDAAGSGFVTGASRSATAQTSPGVCAGAACPATSSIGPGDAMPLSFASAAHRGAIEHLSLDWPGEPLLPAPLRQLARLIKMVVATGPPTGIGARPAAGSGRVDAGGVGRFPGQAVARSSRKITPTFIGNSAVTASPIPGAATAPVGCCPSPGANLAAAATPVGGGGAGAGLVWSVCARVAEPFSPTSFGPVTPARHFSLSPFEPAAGGAGSIAGGGAVALSSQLASLSRAPFWRQHRELFATANALLEPLLLAVCTDATAALATSHPGDANPGSPPPRTRPTFESAAARLHRVTAAAQASAVSRFEASLQLLTPASDPDGVVQHAVCEVSPLLAAAVAESLRDAHAPRGLSPQASRPTSTHYPIPVPRVHAASPTSHELLPVAAAIMPPAASADACGLVARSHTSHPRTDASDGVGGGGAASCLPSRAGERRISAPHTAAAHHDTEGSGGRSRWRRELVFTPGEPPFTPESPAAGGGSGAAKPSAGVSLEARAQPGAAVGRLPSAGHRGNYEDVQGPTAFVRALWAAARGLQAASRVAPSSSEAPPASSESSLPAAASRLAPCSTIDEAQAAHQQRALASRLLASIPPHVLPPSARDPAASPRLLRCLGGVFAPLLPHPALASSELAHGLQLVAAWVVETSVTAWADAAFADPTTASVASEPSRTAAAGAAPASAPLPPQAQAAVPPCGLRAQSAAGGWPSAGAAATAAALSSSPSPPSHTHLPAESACGTTALCSGAESGHAGGAPSGIYTAAAHAGAAGGAGPFADRCDAPWQQSVAEAYQLGTGVAGEEEWGRGGWSGDPGSVWWEAARGRSAAAAGEASSPHVAAQNNGAAAQNKGACRSTAWEGMAWHLNALVALHAIDDRVGAAWLKAAAYQIAARPPPPAAVHRTISRGAGASESGGSSAGGGDGSLGARGGGGISGKSPGGGDTDGTPWADRPLPAWLPVAVGAVRALHAAGLLRRDDADAELRAALLSPHVDGIGGGGGCLPYGEGAAGGGVGLAGSVLGGGDGVGSGTRAPPRAPAGGSAALRQLAVELLLYSFGQPALPPGPSDSCSDDRAGGAAECAEAVRSAVGSGEAELGAAVSAGRLHPPLLEGYYALAVVVAQGARRSGERGLHGRLIAAMGIEDDE